MDYLTNNANFTPDLPLTSPPAPAHSAVYSWMNVQTNNLTANTAYIANLSGHIVGPTIPAPVVNGVLSHSSKCQFYFSRTDWDNSIYF